MVNIQTENKQCIHGKSKSIELFRLVETMTRLCSARAFANPEDYRERVELGVWGDIARESWQYCYKLLFYWFCLKEKKGKSVSFFSIPIIQYSLWFLSWPFCQNLATSVNDISTLENTTTESNMGILPIWTQLLIYVSFYFFLFLLLNMDCCFSLLSWSFLDINWTVNKLWNRAIFCIPTPGHNTADDLKGKNSTNELLISHNC